LNATDTVALANRVANSLRPQVESLYREERITAGIVMEQTADPCYYGHEHTINVPIDDEEVTAENLRDWLRASAKFIAGSMASSYRVRSK
jgi:hypothetical protein